MTRTPPAAATNKAPRRGTPEPKASVATPWATPSEQPIDYIRPYRLIRPAPPHVLAEQARADAALNALRVRVSPSIPWGNVVMIAVAVFLGFALAAQF